MRDTNITFKLSTTEKEAIRKLAAKKDVPISQLVREAVKQYLKQEDLKK